MKEINCSSVESTVGSAADLLGVCSSELRSQLVKDDWESLLLKSLPTPESVVWFHATRIPRTTNYQEGLLPMSTAAPKLLEILKQLALEEKLCSASEWVSIVADLTSQELDWKRSLPESDDGPHGFLVREVIVNRGEIPIMDYTAIPEYVKNLCSGFPENMNLKLQDAFRRYTDRAIVSFRSRLHLEGVLQCALTYARTKLLGQVLSMDCNSGYSGKGNFVHKEDILGIEWLDDISA